LELSNDSDASDFAVSDISDDMEMVRVTGRSFSSVRWWVAGIVDVET
jgi:hypothetical protein